jgi:pimeloyl-ACP methyl ester carboxylesterase
MVEVEAELGRQAAQDFEEVLVVQRRDIYERFVPLLPSITPNDDPFLLGLVRSLSSSVDPLPAPFPGPALFVLGRQDSIVGYRSALDLIEDYPRATVAVLDRAGHVLPWEQPALFGALVSDWLDRLEPSPGT